VQKKKRLTLTQTLDLWYKGTHTHDKFVNVSGITEKLKQQLIQDIKDKKVKKGDVTPEF